MTQSRFRIAELKAELIKTGQAVITADPAEIVRIHCQAAKIVVGKAIFGSNEQAGAVEIILAMACPRHTASKVNRRKLPLILFSDEKEQFVNLINTEHNFSR